MGRNNKKRRGWFPSFLFGGITDYLEEKDNREWAIQEIQRRADALIPNASNDDDPLVFRRCIRQLLRTHPWTNTEIEHVFVALCHLGTARRRPLVILLMQFLMDSYPNRPCYILACHFFLSNIQDARSIVLASRMDAFEFPTGEKLRSWLYKSPQHAKAVLLRYDRPLECIDLVRLVTWGNIRPGLSRDGCLQALALAALLVHPIHQNDDRFLLWEHLLELWSMLTWWSRIVLIRNAPALPQLWKLGWNELCDSIKFETACCILRHNEHTILNNYWASQAVSWIRGRGADIYNIIPLNDCLVVAETVTGKASLLPPGAKLKPLRGDSWMEPIPA